MKNKFINRFTDAWKQADNISSMIQENLSEKWAGFSNKLSDKISKSSGVNTSKQRVKASDDRENKPSDQGDDQESKSSGRNKNEEENDPEKPQHQRYSCKKIKKPDRILILFYMLIIFLESVFKVTVFKELFNIGFIYMLLFSIPMGLILCVICTSAGSKVNCIITVAAISVLTLLYIIQVIYYQVFTTFFAVFSINGAGQVIQFWYEILTAIAKNAVPILLLMVPLLLFILFGKNTLPLEKTSRKYRAVLTGIAVFFQLFATILVYSSNTGELNPHFLYSKAIIPELSVDRFGLLTTTRLDVKHLVFGFDTAEEAFAEDLDDSAAAGETEKPADKSDNAQKIDNINTGNGSENSSNTVIPEEAGTPGTAEAASLQQGFNVMNIDFDRLIENEKNPEIAAMHKYFKNLEPTKKNKYTGMFKGKNLIFITAEGFSPYAVNEEVTPTLYKMKQEGFQFTNFYTPIWGVSTSDGEYVACNSLVPKSGVWSFYVSGRNYMPFCMGNQLKKLNYSTRAYHNHTYTYYHREVSHPNMGYIYKGVGNGLEMTKSWPESDLEMIEKTADEYISDIPFHTYYMTVSGHLRYSFEGNAMSSKNEELVKDLPYSNAVKAYLACNIEFDRAMEKLISRLEQAGIAEDTLIAISPDHYPYGLTVDEISELAGHTVESNFELYKGIFLLWSKNMPHVRIDKPCASMDILPTLSNLMGVEFDSRLLMGRDILSDAPPLVVFSNWSWLTDKASYNSKTKKLMPSAGESDQTVTKEYAGRIAKQVNNKFTYSSKILEKDYYSKFSNKY